LKEKPLAFLSLIEVLETAVGRTTSYSLLEPFPCITFNDYQPAIASIQNAGKIIADHVGLTNLTFVIAVTSQDPSTAGHIELRYDSSNVFVEISQDICGYKDAVLATLCHEICHKFLHARGIRHGAVQVEQEFLTDVAAVYLGMGKIMLNGCECQSSRTETLNGRKTTTTHTLRVGYISRECFAFVYRLVCQMRQIPSEHFLAGLSPAAAEAVGACEWKYGQWLKPEYHTPDGIAAPALSLRGQIVDRQTCAAKCDQTRRELGQKIELLSSRVRDSHKLLFDAEVDIARLLEPNDNPHLRYLNCIKTRESVADLTNAAKHKLAEDQPDWNRLRAVAKAMDSGDENDEPQIIECPVDKTKFRLPGGRKHLVATCPSCKYKFTVITVSLTPKPEKGNKAVYKSRMLQSLKRAFGLR
jgi:hypothetical protein